MAFNDTTPTKTPPSSSTSSPANKLQAPATPTGQHRATARKPTGKVVRQLETPSDPCKQCGKRLARARDMKRHMLTHKAPQGTEVKVQKQKPAQEMVYFDCPWCNYRSCRNMEYFCHHLRHFHSKELKEKCAKCNQCSDQDEFLSEDHLLTCCQYKPEDLPHLPALDQTPHFTEDPEDPPQPPDDPFWLDNAMAPYSDEQDAVQEIQFYWPELRQRVTQPTAISRVIYFRIVGSDIDFSVPNTMQTVYSQVNHPFTCNVALISLLMREAEGDGDTKQFRVWFGQDNRGALLQKNVSVFDIKSLGTAIEKVSRVIDLPESVERPSTAWKLVCHLSFVVFAHLRPAYICGKGSSSLPSYLTNDRNILAMNRDRNQHVYQDALCGFRCIVWACMGDCYDQQTVTDFYDRFRRATEAPENPKDFPGLTESDIPNLEAVFRLSIQIWYKKDKDHIECVKRVTDPAARDIVNLHRFPLGDGYAHYSAIKDLDAWAGRFGCTKCGRLFRRKYHRDRHEKFSCNSGEPRDIYPGGNFSLKPTLFEILAQFGIFVPRDRQRCHHLVALDFEAALSAIQLHYERQAGGVNDQQLEQRLLGQNIPVSYRDEPIRRLQFREVHVPITAAMATTLEDRARFFHNPDPNELVKDVLLSLIALSDESYERKSREFMPEFQRLEALIDQAKAVLPDGQQGFREKAALNKLQAAKQRLERFCRQLTVLLFNGSRYDLNAIKANLFPQLVQRVRESKGQTAVDPVNEDFFETAAAEDTDEPSTSSAGQSLQWPRSIMRGSSILCLQTTELRFLDVVNFLSPGVNLKTFIKTYNPGGQQKSVFPYEFVRSYDDLKATSFPTREQFWSTLKNCTISEEEYAEAEKVWNLLPEKTMLAFCEFYNTLDVVPFLQAAVRMGDIFWQDCDCDIFREAQSAPGVTMAFLFRRLRQIHPLARFGLFEDAQADLAERIYSSLCGGLAVVSHRMVEGGVTPVRPGSNKAARTILGYDANALYLWSMAQPTAMGKPTHWVLEKNYYVRKTALPNADFKKRKIQKEVEYMRFRSFRDHVYIQTADDGEQACIGLHQYRCDGYAPDTSPPTVLFFQGCKWHSHNLTVCLNKARTQNSSSNDADEKMVAELETLGFKVEIEWECHWDAIKFVARQLMRQTPDKIKPNQHQFIEEAKQYNAFLKEHPIRHFNDTMYVRQDTMRNRIIDGRVFGYVLCDLETKPEYREMYQDYPPIIKHAMVSIDDVGDYMAPIAKAHGQLDNPKDALIGSYWAKKHWITTEMLRFYHDRGIEVTAIHEVVQWDKGSPFKFFMDLCTAKRREGDVDKTKAIYGDLYKLLGNSAYGKSLTNLRRHFDVFYCDKQRALEAHNDPYHQRTVVIADDCYEIHMRKKTITWSLPSTIGLFVYSWAKIRILGFIYDAILPFIDQSDHVIIQSDTDSVYMAISGATLEELVPAEKRTQFEATKSQWFVDDTNPLSKREPGIMKVEKTGTSFIGLSAKCYILVGAGDPKVSAKGVQSRNTDALCYENFKKVLLGDPTATRTVHNIGIRPHEGAVKTYIQEKNGLSRCYYKRIVMPDHSTKPLLL